MSVNTLEMNAVTLDVPGDVCTPDSICMFVAPESARMAKYIDQNRAVHPADLCKTFDALEVDIGGLADLGSILSQVLTQPRAFCVRGRLVDGPVRRGIRRLACAQGGIPATLVEHPRRWLALDMDGVVLPSDIEVADLRACAREAIKVLPPEFHGVHVVAQASASHGIKPGARLRLWYFLSRAVGNDELKAWLAGVPYMDPVVFNAAQPIYTAAPLFADGVADHIRCRIVDVPGDPVVEVPPINVPPRSPQPVVGISTGGSTDVGDVSAALHEIPNQDESWEAWSRVGMAVHAATKGSAEGLGAWVAWSAKSSKHDVADCEDRWRHWHSSPAGQLTFGTLVHLAQEAQPGWRAPSWPQGGGCSLEAAQIDFTGFGLAPLPMPFSAEVVGFSEDALALQFSAEHRGDLCYVPALNSWKVWDGARFKDAARGQQWDYARGVCRREANAARREDERLARKLASAQSVAATVRLAQSDPAFARDICDFDADPWALNTPGGVVDLRTGHIRGHDTAGMFTKVTGFTPTGDCPRWLRFLDEITQGDQEVIEYLQRYIGYTITGVTTEHTFILAYGPGGNGKSLLLNTAAAILGDYAVRAMGDVFTANRTEQHPTHLASLRGARMVVGPETEAGAAWAESRLKSLTGGDRISARVMHGNPFEFTPAFKLWIAGNHRPVLKNPDDAMRRRMHILPLTFRPVVPNQGLSAALLSEGAGILKWAIDGCLAWQQAGLRPPATVVNATAEYFIGQDSVSAWLAERCDPVPGAKTKSSELYSNWAGWCIANGIPPQGDQWFSPALEKHYSKCRLKTGVHFVGVAIRPPTKGEGVIAGVGPNGCRG